MAFKISSNRQKNSTILDHQGNKKLLIPGWAGDLSYAEFHFIKDQLKGKARLRSKWGFMHDCKRIPEKKVREIALAEPQNCRNGDDSPDTIRQGRLL